MPRRRPDDLSPDRTSSRELSRHQSRESAEGSDSSPFISGRRLNVVLPGGGLLAVPDTAPAATDSGHRIRPAIVTRGTSVDSAGQREARRRNKAMRVTCSQSPATEHQYFSEGELVSNQDLVHKDHSNRFNRCNTARNRISIGDLMKLDENEAANPAAAIAARLRLPTRISHNSHSNSSPLLVEEEDNDSVDFRTRLATRIGNIADAAGSAVVRWCPWTESFLGNCTVRHLGFDHGDLMTTTVSAEVNMRRLPEPLHTPAQHMRQHLPNINEERGSAVSSNTSNARRSTSTKWASGRESEAIAAFIDQRHFGRVKSVFSWQGLVCSVIVANTCVIALEAAYISNRKFQSTCSVAEFFFTGFYVYEVGHRVWKDTPYKFFYGDDWNWNIFDFAVTASSVVDVTHFAEHKHSAAGAGRLFRVLRILRLFRAGRFLRDVDYVLTTASTATIKLCAVVSLVLFVFAIVATNLLWDAADPEAAAMFCDLGASMWALFKIMTLDNWVEMVGPLMESEPESKAFFVVFIFFGAIALMSLVPTIFIQLKIDQDEERKKRNELKREAKSQLKDHDTLDALFEFVDEEREGTISVAHAQNMLANPDDDDLTDLARHKKWGIGDIMGMVRDVQLGLFLLRAENNFDDLEIDEDDFHGILRQRDTVDMKEIWRAVIEARHDVHLMHTEVQQELVELRSELSEQLEVKSLETSIKIEASRNEVAVLRESIASWDITNPGTLTQEVAMTKDGELQTAKTAAEQAEAARNSELQGRKAAEEQLEAARVTTTRLTGRLRHLSRASVPPEAFPCLGASAPDEVGAAATMAEALGRCEEALAAAEQEAERRRTSTATRYAGLRTRLFSAESTLVESRDSMVKRDSVASEAPSVWSVVDARLLDKHHATLDECQDSREAIVHRTSEVQHVALDQPEPRSNEEALDLCEQALRRAEEAESQLEELWRRADGADVYLQELAGKMGCIGEELARLSGAGASDPRQLADLDSSVAMCELMAARITEQLASVAHGPEAFTSTRELVKRLSMSQAGYQILEAHAREVEAQQRADLQALGAMEEREQIAMRMSARLSLQLRTLGVQSTLETAELESMNMDVMLAGEDALRSVKHEISDVTELTARADRAEAFIRDMAGRVQDLAALLHGGSDHAESPVHFHGGNLAAAVEVCEAAAKVLVSERQSNTRREDSRLSELP